MKTRSILAIAALLCFCAVATAQDLKPVKDRDSKKFGYQDKSKNWVIEPQFDKARRFIDGYAIVEVQGLEGLINTTGGWVLRPDYNSIGKFDKLGFCEVMVKDGRTKLYGLSDRSGRLILPPTCLSISIDRSEEIITARRLADSPDAIQDGLWGVYDLNGEEIFPPEFTTAPSFRRGIGIATSGLNGLVGLIDKNGSVLIPFENIAISDDSGSREVLTTDFTVKTYDARMNLIDELRTPGAVKPYETFGDDVRLAAWHCGPVGRRIHPNNVRVAEINRSAAGRTATVHPLQLHWGYGRFIRLEPEIDVNGRPGSMEHPYTGKPYTLRALMYEADGTYVGVASDFGWLEADFAGGVIYNSEGTQKWIIFDDPNYPVRQRSPYVELVSYNPIDNTDVVSGLGLASADLGRLRSPANRAKREKDIIEGENIGICSYLPRPEPRTRQDAKLLGDAMRLPVFQNAYYMGDVVNCEVKKVGEEYRVRLSDRLILPFEDKFRDPSYSMYGEEEIYWGPNNNRVVALDLEIAGTRAAGVLEDNLFGSDRHFNVLITMYDEEGNYLRTLAGAPAIDFIKEGVVIFEKLGIALITRGAAFRTPHGELIIPASERLAPSLSALQGAGGFQPQPGNNGINVQGKPAPKPGAQPTAKRLGGNNQKEDPAPQSGVQINGFKKVTPKR